MTLKRTALQWLKKAARIPVRQTQAYLGAVGKPMWVDPREEGRRRSPTTAMGGILVLDYALPKPDQDAGSRNTYEHMVSLVNLGYRVWFWPHDGLDVPRYTRALEKVGVQVVAGYFRPALRHWLARHRQQVSTVLLNRPAVAEAHLAALRAAGLPIAYYGHDLHFARLRMEASKVASPALDAQWPEMEKLERGIWRQANVSTYPSQEEADEVARLEPAVAARALQAFCYDDFTDRTRAPAGHDIMFVGSFRHPPNIQAAKLLAQTLFPQVRQQVPDARLVIAGAFATDEIKALAGDGVHVAGWMTDQELADLYAGSRLAVVPLMVGAGVKLKVVEALANGTPLVTTPVGAQGLFGLDQVIPVYEQEDRIVQAMVATLHLDDSEWLQLSHAQQDYARDNFSRDSMSRALAEVIALAKGTAAID